MIRLYLGGARSGKSGHAEDWCHQSDKRVTYVATARRHPSMEARVQLHQARRPEHWRCIEEPLDLVGLLNLAQNDELLLIDCLTLWLTNVMMTGASLPTERISLIDALLTTKAEVVLVSTEVGQGLIPEDEMSQQFVIAAGELHQAIAEVADAAIWCQSGLALSLKDN